MQEKQIDIKLINIIENWLCKSRSIIDWDGITANPVICSAGVRQGGVLSPVLFSIFVDVLLEKMQHSGLGCFINFGCQNSLMYADFNFALCV